VTSDASVRWVHKFSVDTDKHRVNIVGMEPAERMAKVLVKLAFMVFTLIVSLVFDEFGHGVIGFVVCVVGIAFGMIALNSVEDSVRLRPHFPPATAVTTSNKILGPRRTSSTRIRSSFPCSVLPSSSVAV